MYDLSRNIISFPNPCDYCGFREGSGKNIAFCNSCQGSLQTAGIDIEKVRRRNRDALNKTRRTGEILMVAEVLGVKVQE